MLAEAARAAGQDLVAGWDRWCDLGLPYAATTILRYLGREPGGPADGELVVGPWRGPAWQALVMAAAGTLDGAAVREAVAARAPAERVALIADAVTGPHRVTSPRRATEYGVPGGPERANDHTSRAIELAAELLGQHAAAVAWATSAADDEAARESRRADTALIAALVLARAARADGVEPPAVIDRLAALDLPPASTYRQALRTLLALLPPARVVALTASAPLSTYAAYRDPSGEVRRWRAGAGWAWLDLVPAEVAATRALAAVRERARHDASGADLEAAPLAGSTTSTLRQRPGDDEPLPRAAAVAALAGAGRAWLDAIAPESPLERELLDEARARLDTKTM